MNQIHRIGLVVASVAAALLVAGALAVEGYTNAQHAAAQATDSPTAAPATDPAATLDPMTIYVNPPATPPVITITHTAPPVGPAATPPVIHVTVTAPGGDDGGDGHEVDD
jgi:hypothetical protein